VNLTAVASQDGGIYAVWTEHIDPMRSIMQGAASSPNLYFAHRPLGGDWGARELINDDSRDSRSNPTIAVDRQGNAYAAWVDYRDGVAAIYAATRPVGGEWGRNAKVSSGAANGYTGLAIIMDWEGTVHATWEGLNHCGGDEAILSHGE
jgi:hypothetical protein